MKCPACFNELKSLQVGALVVDVCQGGCGGVWFDAFELQRVEQSAEGSELLLRIEKDDQVVVDPARKRECPRCQGVKLHRHFFSARRRVQVDECPNCAGYWLDAGELAEIQAERAQGAELQQARRSSISAEMIRYLYRLQSRERER